MKGKGIDSMPTRIGKHISHNHYRVSDADAGRLAKAVNAKLPRPGYMLRIELPDGRAADLLRTPYSCVQAPRGTQATACRPRLDLARR